MVEFFYKIKLGNNIKIYIFQFSRAISSAGRASRLHRECRQFEPVIAHHFAHEMDDQI